MSQTGRWSQMVELSTSSSATGCRSKTPPLHQQQLANRGLGGDIDIYMRKKQKMTQWMAAASADEEQ